MANRIDWYPTATPPAPYVAKVAPRLGYQGPTKRLPSTSTAKLVDAPASQLRIVITLPRQDNDKINFRGVDWEWVEAHFIANWGAYTRLPNVEGAWRNDAGATILDSSRQYMVIIPTTDRDAMRSLCKKFAARFRQDCILATFEPIVAEFITV